MSARAPILGEVRCCGLHANMGLEVRSSLDLVVVQVVLELVASAYPEAECLLVEA